jgi:hypothetical protein
MPVGFNHGWWAAGGIPIVPDADNGFVYRLGTRSSRLLSDGCKAVLDRLGQVLPLLIHDLGTDKYYAIGFIAGKSCPTASLFAPNFGFAAHRVKNLDESIG